MLTAHVSFFFYLSFFSQKTPESTAAVLAAIPAYQAAVHDAVSTSLASTPSAATFDAARLKQLVKNALSAARLTVQLSSQAKAAQAWSVADWISLVAAAKNNERFKGAVAVQTLIKQLVSVLGGSVADEGAAGKKDKKKQQDKKRKASVDDDATAAAKKAKADDDEEAPAMNEVEVEVEMDDDEVAPAASAKGTPSKKEKKDKKKRRRSEGKA